MGVLYILNYVDRSALAATKVYGIMEDLGMDAQQFATAISILFGEILLPSFEEEILDFNSFQSVTFPSRFPPT